MGNRANGEREREIESARRKRKLFYFVLRNISPRAHSYSCRRPATSSPKRDLPRSCWLLEDSRTVSSVLGLIPRPLSPYRSLSSSLIAPPTDPEQRDRPFFERKQRDLYGRHVNDVSIVAGRSFRSPSLFAPSFYLSCRPEIRKRHFVTRRAGSNRRANGLLTIGARRFSSTSR